MGNLFLALQYLTKYLLLNYMNQQCKADENRE